MLFSSRNNFLLWITNWSHTTYLLLHRWVEGVEFDTWGKMWQLSEFAPYEAGHSKNENMLDFTSMFGI